MVFSLRHHQFRACIYSVVGSVPINDYAINATAHHIVNLPLDLRGIGGTVADIHMVRRSEPKEEMRINFCSCSGIKQRVNIDLTHIAGAPVAVGLAREIIRCTGVIGSLKGKIGGRYDVRGTGRRRSRSRRSQEHHCSKIYTTHLVLRGGVEPRLARAAARMREGTPACRFLELPGLLGYLGTRSA